MVLKIYVVLFIVIQVLHGSHSSYYTYTNNSDFESNSRSDSYLLNELNQLIGTGKTKVNQETKHNNRRPLEGIYMKRTTPGFLRFNIGPIPHDLHSRQTNSRILIKILQLYYHKYAKSHKSAKKAMKEIYDSKIEAVGICQKKTKSCTKDDLKYRSFDGTCNNMKNAYWGAAETTFTRFIYPDYDDAISKPRRAVSGQELPSARKITIKVFHSQHREDPKFTMMASQMAQFIAHDTHNAIPDNVDKGPIRCCTESGNFLPAAKMHSSCMPISIPSDDPVYKRYKQKCMNFIRSVTATPIDCIVGPAEQVNMVTSYLDCSFVYGNHKELADSLRTRRNGKLRESSHRMLPLTDYKECDYRRQGDACYIAGDRRVNQNPHLVAMHVVFLREHNRLAHKLHELNPRWSDEKLFQEARRILIAEYQHIVFQEYLPHFIGKKFIKELFVSDRNGFTRKYEERTNPGSINSMNVAFRCYHSTIPDKVRLCDNTCKITAEYPFSNFYTRPVISKDHEDEILNSLTCSRMTEMSDGFTREITDKLFKSTLSFGLDLLALDIQRERDHGIPSYNSIRQLVGRKRALNFEDLEKDMGKDKVAKLRKVYKHVDDIDLIVGSQLEKHVEGTQFGPVTLVILREQFRRYMVGDRFFYTNKDQDYPFTPKQLREIKKVTIARLICDNSKDISTVQPDAFLKVSDRNQQDACYAIPEMDLSHWQE